MSDAFGTTVHWTGEGAGTIPATLAQVNASGHYPSWGFHMGEMTQFKSATGNIELATYGHYINEVGGFQGSNNSNFSFMGHLGAYATQSNPTLGIAQGVQNWSATKVGFQVTDDLGVLGTLFIESGGIQIQRYQSGLDTQSMRILGFTATSGSAPTYATPNRGDIAFDYLAQDLWFCTNSSGPVWASLSATLKSSIASTYLPLGTWQKITSSQLLQLAAGSYRIVAVGGGGGGGGGNVPGSGVAQVGGGGGGGGAFQEDVYVTTGTSGGNAHTGTINPTGSGQGITGGVPCSDSVVAGDVVTAAGTTGYGLGTQVTIVNTTGGPGAHTCTLSANSTGSGTATASNGLYLNLGASGTGGTVGNAGGNGGATQVQGLFNGVAGTWLVGEGGGGGAGAIAGQITSCQGGISGARVASVTTTPYPRPGDGAISPINGGANGRPAGWNGRTIGGAGGFYSSATIGGTGGFAYIAANGFVPATGAANGSSANGTAGTNASLGCGGGGGGAAAWNAGTPGTAGAGGNGGPGYVLVMQIA
jgi:hypothetical protein